MLNVFSATHVLSFLMFATTLQFNPPARLYVLDYGAPRAMSLAGRLFFLPLAS